MQGEEGTRKRYKFVKQILKTGTQPQHRWICCKTATLSGSVFCYLDLYFLFYFAVCAQSSSMPFLFVPVFPPLWLPWFVSPLSCYPVYLNRAPPPCLYQLVFVTSVCKLSCGSCQTDSCIWPVCNLLTAGFYLLPVCLSLPTLLLGLKNLFDGDCTSALPLPITFIHISHYKYWLHQLCTSFAPSSNISLWVFAVKYSDREFSRDKWSPWSHFLWVIVPFLIEPHKLLYITMLQSFLLKVMMPLINPLSW